MEDDTRYLEQSIFWEQLIGYNTYKKATGIVHFILGRIFVKMSKPKLFSTEGSNGLILIQPTLLHKLK